MLSRLTLVTQTSIVDLIHAFINTMSIASIRGNKMLATLVLLFVDHFDLSESNNTIRIAIPCIYVLKWQFQF